MGTERKSSRRSPRRRPARAAGPRGPETSVAELRSLAGSVERIAGPELCEELCFRLGRRWGESQAGGARRDGGPREHVQRGLERMAALELAQVELEELPPEADGGRFALRGRVLLPKAEGAAPPGELASLCMLTVGFLTGFVAAETGLDLVCSPLQCRQGSSDGSCSFEIGPAVHQTAAPGPAGAPAGSARFYLGCLGPAFAEADISLDDLIENVSDAVVLLDSDDVVRYWNRGAERLFQWSRDEVVGRPAGFIVPPDLLAADELGWIRGQLRERDSVCDHVTRRVRRDGRELWISLTRTRLHDSRGRLVGSTAVLRDITATRRTEEELDRSRRLALVGELSARIAHEMKNPLAGIYAAVQLLGRSMPGEDPKRAVLEDVAREILRLDETVQDLLHFARPLPPRLRPAHLRTFVLEALEHLRLQPDLRHHELRVEIPEDLLVQLDPRLMSQVVSNVVLNAAQAMGAEPGAIAVRGARAGALAVLEVQDEGPGVPPELRESVFEPFFTTRSRGTGLGLAIARKNVEGHGGTLRAAEAPGGGASFRIEIPAWDPPPR